MELPESTISGSSNDDDASLDSKAKGQRCPMGPPPLPTAKGGLMDPPPPTGKRGLMDPPEAPMPKKPKKEFDAAGERSKLLPDLLAMILSAEKKGDSTLTDAQAVLQQVESSSHSAILKDATDLLRHRIEVLRWKRN